jgi:hypothetical protein
MADEQTDVTNSEPTPTGAPAATDTSSSTTDPTPADPPQGDPVDPVDPVVDPAVDPAADADPLDDAGDLADVPKGDEDDPDPDANPLHGAPEGDDAYDLTGLLPEGMSLDPAALEAFTPTAKELNLSPAGLAKLAEAGLPVVEQRFHQGLIADVVAQRKGWETESRNMMTGYKADDGTQVAPDPIFAGSNYDDVMAVAAKGIDRLTTDEQGQPRMYAGANADGTPGTFRDFLKSTGLGTHPAMVQAFYLVGHKVSEDTDFIRHGDVPKTKLSREERYYGNKTT